MTDRTETVLAEAAEAYFQGLERDGYRPEGCSGAWAAEHILAALKAARIAVVELPEPRVQYDAEGDSPAEWETGVPDALVSAFSDPPEVFIDSDSMRPDQARGLAAALLAAADAAEASQ